jgi:transposase
MRLSEKNVEEILSLLERIREEIVDESEKKSMNWEKNRDKVKERLRMLPAYVRKASESIMRQKKAGRPQKLSIYHKLILFLLTRMLNKSNRDMENILMFFKPISGMDVSYKYIERLYSDEEVRMALHNLFILLLRDEGISGDFSGDGTGYSLSITKHYRTGVKKESKEYRYSFRIIDIDTGLYVALGYSDRSEMDAFRKAMKMLDKLDIKIDSMRLDRYYSSRKIIRMFNDKTALYLIPKKNMRKFGIRWRKILKRMVEDPYSYMKQYFMRNLSESAFSADKRRFGWKIRQRREDRREMALFAIGLLHNVFSVRGVG